MLIGRGKMVMRAMIGRGLTMALIVLGLFLPVAPRAAAQSTQITLLHISDTHSHLAAWGPKDANLDGTLGGLPKAATVVARERASDQAALFVHAGDFMEGDLFFNEYFGVPELQLLKQIGLDALALGNHEFRFGPTFLVTVLQNAWSGGGVPILGTNLQIPTGNELAPWVSSTLIKDVHGVKVGFFGLTPPDAALESPDPVVILDDLTAISQTAVDTLRGTGAQVVVCVSHNGLEVARGLAGNVTGIDLIVNGHDNAVLDQPEPVERPGGGTTLIVSAGNHYRWVGRLRLSVTGDTVSLVDYALLSVDADVPPSPTVQLPIDNLKAGIVAWYGDVYHQPLARAERDITMDWVPDKAKRDTPLGNLFTDAYRAWTGTDIALEPFAYMGDPLPEGPIVGADVFRAMSYGNLKTVSGRRFVRPWRLATFYATGADLMGVLEVLLYLGGDYFPQASGLRLQYDSTAPPLQRILLDTVEVGGQPLQAGQFYSVTVTEQISAALAFVLGLPMTDVVTLPTYAFDAVRSYAISRHVLSFATSGRIRDVAAIMARGREARSEVRR